MWIVYRRLRLRFYRVLLNKTMAYVASVISIIISAIFSSPLFFHSKLEAMFKDASFCYQDWPSAVHAKAYFSTSFILQFLLPFMIVMYVYKMIYDKFRVTSTSVTNHASQQKRRQTNLLLFWNTLIFFISWCPINIFILTITFIKIDLVSFL